MEDYYEFAAARWWIESLRWNDEKRNVEMPSLDGVIDIPKLTDMLASKIKKAVEEWNDKTNIPYSIDTTGVCDPILEEVLNEAGIKELHFQNNVLMEITKKSVIVKIQSTIFNGE